MRIDIQSRNRPLQEQLGGFIKKRLQRALGRFSEQIQRVRVTLSDLNGPKGGVDQQCKLQIFMPPMQPVIIEDRELHLRKAVVSATERASISVRRQLERKRHVTHQRIEPLYEDSESTVEIVWKR